MRLPARGERRNDGRKWVIEHKSYTPWYLVRYYRLAKFKAANPHVVLRGMVFLGKGVEIEATPELAAGLMATAQLLAERSPEWGGDARDTLAEVAVLGLRLLDPGG